MKSIYKYPLDPGDSFIWMPEGAQILCVQTQRESPQIWALVDPNETKMEARQIRTYGTGHDVPDDPGKYIGSFQLASGSYVFHVFDHFGDS
jgi:hypothetical protein